MDNKKYKQFLTNSILVYKYGFDGTLEKLQEAFSNYKDDHMYMKNIYSLTNGIIRFEFLITDENIKAELKDIEQTLDKSLQEKIYYQYITEFKNETMTFFLKEIEAIKEELENENPDFEYIISNSQVNIFTYLKNSALLRIEFII